MSDGTFSDIDAQIVLGWKKYFVKYYAYLSVFSAASTLLIPAWFGW